MEDAVFLAHSLRTTASVEAALRDYETERKERTKFVVEQSWELGKVFQLSNPIAIWLRNVMSRTKYAHQRGEKLFERLLEVELPILEG